MEAKNRTHRYYVEETKVDLLGIDHAHISSNYMFTKGNACAVILMEQNL